MSSPLLSSVAAPARRTRDRRTTIPMPRGVRRTVLVVHIVSAVGWMGMDLVIAVLALRAWTADDAGERAVSMQALELFGVVPMISLALLSLVSGVLLGLGTSYGLVRFWWVTVKLVLNLVFCVLLVVALRPGLREAADQGAQLAAGDTTATFSNRMAFPVVVSLSGLLVANVLSVFKPWGRIRKERSDVGTGSGRSRS